MSEATELLRAARDLLSEPGAWTQGVSARDQYGLNTDPIQARAVQWCCLGAIWNRSGYLLEDVALDAERALCAVIGGDIPSFNDAPDRTLDEVLDMFGLAIKRSEES